MNAHHLHTAASTIHGAHIPQGLLGALIAIIVFLIARALVKAFFRGLGGGSR